MQSLPRWPARRSFKSERDGLLVSFLAALLLTGTDASAFTRGTVTSSTETVG